MSTLPPISHDASVLYARYARCLQDWTGLHEQLIWDLGMAGARLFEAEHRVMGDAAYATSIIQPIRNARYMAHGIEERWAKLRHHNIIEPVLDYGCGVGFTSAWLVDLGVVDEAYVWEPPGVQRDFLLKYGGEFGLKVWDGQPPTFNTILCINVLEHLDDPMGLLGKLRAMAPKVIANCVLSDDHTHVAGREVRLAVNADLWARGEHLEPVGDYGQG